MLLRGLFQKQCTKAKCSFFGDETAIATSSRSSPLPSTYSLQEVLNVFSDCFLQKVESIRADLDQQSLSLTRCRLTDQHVDSNFHSIYPVTEAVLKATLLKSKPTSRSLNHLPTPLLEFMNDLLPTLSNFISFSCLVFFHRL